MEIIKAEHQTIFQSSDERGTFQIRVQNDLSQIQLHTEVDEWDNSDYADTNRNEIEMLRDMLTQMLSE